MYGLSSHMYKQAEQNNPISKAQSLLVMQIHVNVKQMLWVGLTAAIVRRVRIFKLEVQKATTE